MSSNDSEAALPAVLHRAEEQMDAIVTECGAHSPVRT